MGSAEIEVFTVRRYRCPHCPRTASSPKRIREHMSRCWLNPDNRTCKTCAHLVPDQSESEVGILVPEECAVGVSLLGEPHELCGGTGLVAGVGYCPGCGGYGAPHIGPIVGCSLWTLRQDGA